MLNESHQEITEACIRSRLPCVTAQKAAWVLLQEPGFIGFGAVYEDKICWPPCIEQLDWKRIRDLRLFGEKGEWHVWPHWDKKCPWKSRLLKLENVCDALTEYHVLWGTWPPQPEVSPWIKLVETRGTEIWLPLAELKLIEADFPLRLELRQVVGYDDKDPQKSSHLAGITDAALVALVNESCDKVVYPNKVVSVSSSLPCSESESETADGTSNASSPEFANISPDS